MVAAVRLDVSFGLPPGFFNRRGAWSRWRVALACRPGSGLRCVGCVPRVAGTFGYAACFVCEVLRLVVEFLGPVVPGGRTTVVTRQDDPGEDVHRHSQAAGNDGRGNPEQSNERRI